MKERKDGITSTVVTRKQWNTRHIQHKGKMDERKKGWNNKYSGY